MSEPREAVFPVLDSASPRIDWMRHRGSEARPVSFSEPGARRAEARPSSPATPVQSQVAAAELRLAVELDEAQAERARERAELEAERQSLEAERQSLEAERQSLEAERARFIEAVESIVQARRETFQEAEADLADLAVTIADALIGTSLSLEPPLHLTMARAALEALGDIDGVELRASSEAYRAIVDSCGSPRIPFQGREVSVQLDSTLEGLGCVASLGLARVDARVQARLAQVREAVLAERRRGADQ